MWHCVITSFCFSFTFHSVSPSLSEFCNHSGEWFQPQLTAISLLLPRGQLCSALTKLPGPLSKRPPRVFIFSNTYPCLAQHLPGQGKLEGGGLDDDLDGENQSGAVLGMVLSASVSPALLPLPQHSLIFQPVTGKCCVSMSQMCLFILFWLLLEKGTLQDTKQSFLRNFHCERFSRNEKQAFHSTWNSS